VSAEIPILAVKPGGTQTNEQQIAASHEGRQRSFQIFSEMANTLQYEVQTSESSVGGCLCSFTGCTNRVCLQ
jgi:hypothetical protein